MTHRKPKLRQPQQEQAEAGDRAEAGEPEVEAGDTGPKLPEETSHSDKLSIVESLFSIMNNIIVPGTVIL
jgi:hypothetical protein